jgi:hypothetical protein
LSFLLILNSVPPEPSLAYGEEGRLRMRARLSAAEPEGWLEITLAID